MTEQEVIESREAKVKEKFKELGYALETIISDEELANRRNPNLNPHYLKNLRADKRQLRSIEQWLKTAPKAENNLEGTSLPTGFVEKKD